MFTIKFILGILFILSGGSLFAKSFQKNKALIVAATIVVIISSYYLFQNIYNGIVQIPPPLTIDKGFPKGLNILIFNASSNKYSHQSLKDRIYKIDTSAKIDAQYNWLNRFVMSKTRIYFLGSKNRDNAFLIAKLMPGDQDVIDYYLQLNDKQGLFLQDKSSAFFSRMVGINKKRDIIIFIGEDYREVLGMMSHA